MKKIFSIIFLFAFLGIKSQSSITPLNLWQTNGNTFATSANWLGTRNAQNLVIKTNSVTCATFSTNGAATLGTGTVAANTTSLGVLRVKQGTSWLDFGEYSSGNSGIWAGQTTPSLTNYLILGSPSNCYLNASSSVKVRVNSAFQLSLDGSTGYVASAFRIGSQVAPSATLDVTGTMSVSGTSTLSGNTEFQGIATTPTINNNTSILFTLGGGNRGFWTTNGLTIGSSASPAATLNVVGTMSVSSTATFASTVKIGSGVLTGGNTGTVAVLSDALYPITFMCQASGQSPSDAQTSYFGNIIFSSWSATQGAGKIYIPNNSTLVGWTANVFVNGTLASAENSTLSIGVDNSFTSLSGSVTMSATAQTFSASGLSTSINSGSYIEARLVNPTWITNPTNTSLGITLWFVRRP